MTCFQSGKRRTESVPACFQFLHGQARGDGQVKTMSRARSLEFSQFAWTPLDPILKFPRYTVTALEATGGRVIVGVKINKYTGGLSRLESLIGWLWWTFIPERIGYGLVGLQPIS